MSAADQDLVRQMLSDCDAYASTIFHDASTGIPASDANLGREGDEDIDISIDTSVSCMPHDHQLQGNRFKLEAALKRNDRLAKLRRFRSSIVYYR